MDEPICPICGESCNELYTDKNGDIIGCDNCVSTIDAWEWLQDQELNKEILKAESYYDYLKEEGLLAV